MTANPTNRYKFKKVFKDFREVICALDAHSSTSAGFRWKNHCNILVVFKKFLVLFSFLCYLLLYPLYPLPKPTQFPCCSSHVQKGAYGVWA